MTIENRIKAFDKLGCFLHEFEFSSTENSNLPLIISTHNFISLSEKCCFISVIVFIVYSVVIV